MAAHVTSPSPATDNVAAAGVDQPRWRRFGAPLALCILWAAMVIAVNPIGDFPLNDDFTWGQSVKTLYESHVLTVSPWADAAVIAQIAWGFLACLPWGFSYTALRLATALFGLGAVLATYALSREAGASRWIAFLCAFAVAANPLIFESSNTFMTETPFLAFFLLSMLSFVRAARSGSLLTAGLAILLALAATLTRQLGMLIPVLFIVGCVLSRLVTVRTIVFGAAAMATVRYGLHQYEHWLDVSGQTGAHGQIMKMVIDQLMHPFTQQMGALTLRDGFQIAFTYIGCILLPPLLALIPRRLNAKVSVLVAAVVAAAVAGTTGLAVVQRQWSMPFAPHFNLIDLGLGPATLTDVFIKYRPNLPRADPMLWLKATKLGFVGGGLALLLCFITGFELLSSKVGATGKSGKLVAAMALTFVGGYGLVLLVMPFDRYFVPIFPMVLLAGVWGTDVALRARATRLLSVLLGVVAVLGLSVQAAFSVAATHDYLAWNRARWVALHELMDVDGITPYAIDGGYEFNGLYRTGAPADPYTRDEPYMIAFGPVPGYQTLHTYPYFRWIGASPGTILALVKEAPKPS